MKKNMRRITIAINNINKIMCMLLNLIVKVDDVAAT